MTREEFVNVAALCMCLLAIIATSFLSAYQHAQSEGFEGVKLFLLSWAILGVLSIRIYRRIMKKKNKEVLK